ncbi:MAG: hypothetical protein H0U91_08295 [Rubrobacter sp.]|jgi:hypothetical protein|nr:hypothetical protein [Rubrobacter sp.]MBA3950391.1 hypothetical protein [Rubrobacter sp.]MDQ3362511.1 hypothetical protein [Actinomycetota bacterium]MDQ3376320.1 hypothetical protein [Actinomycetota bacterium]
MTRENGRDGQEPRDLARVSEERLDGSGSDDANSESTVEAGWLESGAEDPAFFIKPSDGE